MGRAIVRRPGPFLMDEPLSNLDSGLRAELRAEITGLTRELGEVYGRPATLYESTWAGVDVRSRRLLPRGSRTA